MYKIPHTFLNFEKKLFDNVDWMELQVFEMQLLELLSSSIWRQKYVDLRVRPQIIN